MLEKYGSAFNTPGERRSASTSCYGDRQTRKHEDSRAQGGCCHSRSSKARGCFSASRVDIGPKTNSTSFCMKAEPPALPCRDGVLVENGAAAPKSCLPSLEMRSPTAAGGLLPTGKGSIATRITFNHPPLRLSTEETSCKKTLIPYVSCDSSFSQKNNLPAASSCRRVIETKSGENRIFDPGGSRSSARLPVFGVVARVALWEGSCLGWVRLQRFFGVPLRLGHQLTGEWYARTYSGIAGSSRLGRL